jgi:transposase
MKARRMKAARLFASGRTQAEVARALEISRQSVSRWYQSWKRDGRKGLKGAGRAGRKARLTPQQLKEVDRALREGPQVHGYATHLWTLPRVAAVIEDITGVSYHPGHVWKLLRQLGWTLQRPAKRARERDEDAILRWVAESWPAIKKKRGANKPGLSSKTRAASRSARRSDARGHREGRHRS